MLSDADRKKAADILMTAEKERKQAPQLTKTWPDITFEDAYAISTEVANRKIAAGAKLIGHKVGLTSKAMQRSSQIDEPDYGHLLDNMMIADGAQDPAWRVLPAAGRDRAGIYPRQKAEGPGRRPAGSAARDRIRGAGDRDRRRAPAGPAQDLRHHLRQRCGGGHRDRRPSRGSVGCRSALGRRHHVQNSEIEETGVAAGVLGHPALGVAWLANKLGQHGVALEPGHLVLAGSFTRVVFAKKGDTLHADFGPLGGIAVQFV